MTLSPEMRRHLAFLRRQEVVTTTVDGMVLTSAFYKVDGEYHDLFLKTLKALERRGLARKKRVMAEITDLGPGKRPYELVRTLWAVTKRGKRI